MIQFNKSMVNRPSRPKSEPALISSKTTLSRTVVPIDIHELARQNKITQQILQYYLQRRLGLARSNMRPPSVDEILPTAKISEDRHVRESGREETQQEPEQYHDEDNLQSVESEHVDSVYPDGIDI
ncbi:hypothetical protein EVAR_10105_1 [Eumeta japonica]|uniref:Uncharacterized protein n=1 Tax=Eumeta variegata TaxID=151549 RepID=A0A4C1UDK5_EUMVA|nr:hypothetical protein EVAR_10105_1 [Eumeta japonica]